MSFKLTVSIKDNIFKATLYICAVLVLLVFVGIVVTLFIESYPAVKENGIALFTKGVWDPVNETYSILPFVVGTIVTSILSLLISVLFSIPISILIGEYLANKRYGRIVRSVVDLIAGVPSIIFGFWGMMVLVPVVRRFEEFIGVEPLGIGIFTASLILSIMIIPYTTTIAQEVIRLVPQDIKEAAYSLGATRFEIIKDIILPYARSGIVAGILLSFGRAFGETMAVTMVIGNANYVPKSIFAPASTMASVIANEFAEATSDLHLSALVSLGFILLLISLITNGIGRYIIRRFSRGRLVDG